MDNLALWEWDNVLQQVLQLSFNSGNVILFRRRFGPECCQVLYYTSFWCLYRRHVLGSLQDSLRSCVHHSNRSHSPRYFCSSWRDWEVGCNRRIFCCAHCYGSWWVKFVIIQVGLWVYYFIGTGLFKSNISPLVAEQNRRNKLYVVTTKDGERVIVDHTMTISRVYMVIHFVLPPHPVLTLIIKSITTFSLMLVLSLVK